jgi:hypothetical protein
MPRRFLQALVTTLVLAFVVVTAACTPLEPRDKEREKNAGGGTMLHEPSSARSY